MDSGYPVSKVTGGDNMGVHAVQRIDDGQNQPHHISWGTSQEGTAPVALHDSSAPVSATQRIEGEDMHSEGGHKGLMDKMKDAGRRLKDKVKGSIGHNKDNDESEADILNDPKRTTTPDSVYAQYAMPSDYKDTTDAAHGSNQEASYERRTGTGYGEKGSDLQKPGHSYAAGMPLGAEDVTGEWQKAGSRRTGTGYGEKGSDLQKPGHSYAAGMPLGAEDVAGEWQKADSSYPATPSVSHTHSVPTMPGGAVPSGDFTSTESMDTSSGGFGSITKSAGTGLYDSTAVQQQLPSGVEKDDELQRVFQDLKMTGKEDSISSTPAVGGGLKGLVGDERRAGLAVDEGARMRQEDQMPTALGQKSAEGTNIYFGGKGRGDEEIARTDQFELGRGNQPKVVGNDGGEVVFSGEGTNLPGVKGNEKALQSGNTKGGSVWHGPWRDRLLHVWFAVLNYVTQICAIFSWRDGAAAGRGQGGRSLWQDVKESAAGGQAHGVAKVATNTSTGAGTATVKNTAGRTTFQKLGAAAAVMAEKAKVEAGFGSRGIVDRSLQQQTVEKEPVKQRVRGSERVRASVISAAAVVGTAVGSLGAAMGYYGEEGMEKNLESDAVSDVTEEGGSGARRGNDNVAARGAGGAQTIGSRLASGATAAKDTVVGSTAAAITAASGVTSSIAQKVGYGQQQQPPVYKSKDTAPVSITEGSDLEEVRSPQTEGYLGTAARKIGEGKDAVAQRFGYGGGQQQTGIEGKSGVVGFEGESGVKPQSEGYLASVTRTLGDGKEVVAQRLGFGGGQKGEQTVDQGAYVPPTGTGEKSNRGGVVGAVSGTVGAVAGTVGGVKDTVVRSLGYGASKGEGAGTGLAGDVKESSTTSSPATGTWKDSAYGAVSGVAGMATRAKDVVAEKVGMGKSTGAYEGSGVEQNVTVPGAGGVPHTASQQVSVGLANVKEGTFSGVESGKEAVQSALGYGPEGRQTIGGEGVQGGSQEGKGILKSVYDTVATTAGSVTGAVATRLGYGVDGVETVPSDTGAMEVTEPGQQYITQVKTTTAPVELAPASGYGKVRGELTDLHQAEKAADYTKPNAEAAKYVVDEVRESLGATRH